MKGAALIVLVATAVWGQQSKLAVFDPSWQGLEVQFVTRVEPPGENARAELPGGVVVEHGRVHHSIRDAAHKRDFAYDIELEPNLDGKTVQIRIKPFTSTRVSFVEPGWTLLAPPKYPVIPMVKVGDTVALDLLVNQATGQKVVDYLTVVRHNEPAPHDFTMADVVLALHNPRVWVNGMLIDATAHFSGGTSGPVVWLYLAGHGRFVLSLWPNEKLGFQKNGEAWSDKLTFREGSTELRVQSNTPVAPGTGRYNLYVVHEPGWRPNGPDQPFTLGSADNAEWVVGKH